MGQLERPPLLTMALCWMLSASAAAQAPDESWRLARQGEHVAIYTREVAGSRFLESLGRTTLETRLSTLTALIMDGESYSRWIDKIDESRQLDAVSSTESYIYTLSGAPWPVGSSPAPRAPGRSP